MIRGIAFALIDLSSSYSGPQPASAQTPFYQGKTITIIAAAKPGDVYDLYPRLVAEFMPKHIPGNPNIIIQNVAGAAGSDRHQSGLQYRQT